jgi:23S rRNA (guanosine2251-2'-O)-methyltransferase
MSELIYGRRAVSEALRANRRHFFRLWVEGEGAQVSGILAEITGTAEALKIPIRFIQGGLFDRMKRENVNHQGVALETGGYPYVGFDELLRRSRRQDEPPFLLILDHLQDPQNLGALFRTAEAMGVHGVVLPDRRAASVTPAVSNASAGAVEHLSVAQIKNINRAIDELKGLGIWVVGLEKGEGSIPLVQADLNGPLALVVGSEGKGMSRLTREKCDFRVHLPMWGKVESLNAAVAGSIALYEARIGRVRAEAG